MTKLSTLVLLLICISPNAAFAYIDPGSGSAIMSMMVGAFVATGLAIKTFWYKIKSLFTAKSSRLKDDQERVPPDSPPGN